MAVPDIARSEEVDALAARIAAEFVAVRGELGAGGSSRLVTAAEGVYTRPDGSEPVLFVGSEDATSAMESGDSWILTEDIMEGIDVVGQYSGTGTVTFTPSTATVGDTVLVAIVQDSEDEVVSPPDGWWGAFDYADADWTANTYGGRLVVWGYILQSLAPITVDVGTPAHAAWAATVFHSRRNTPGASMTPIQPTGTSFVVPESVSTERYVLGMLAYSTTPAVPTAYPAGFQHIVTAGNDGRRVFGAMQTVSTAETGTTSESVDSGIVTFEFPTVVKYLSGTYVMQGTTLRPAPDTPPGYSGQPADFFFSITGGVAPGWYTDFAVMMQDIADFKSTSYWSVPLVVGFGVPAGAVGPNITTTVPAGTYNFNQIVFKSLMPRDYNRTGLVDIYFDPGVRFEGDTNFELTLDGVNVYFGDSAPTISSDDSLNVYLTLYNGASVINVGTAPTFEFNGGGNFSVNAVNARPEIVAADTGVTSLTNGDEPYSISIYSDSVTGYIDPLTFTFPAEGGSLSYHVTAQGYTGGMREEDYTPPENASYSFTFQPTLTSDQMYHTPSEGGATVTVQAALDALTGDGGGGVPTLQDIVEAEGGVGKTTGQLGVVDDLDDPTITASVSTSGFAVGTVPGGVPDELAILAKDGLSFKKSGSLSIGGLVPPTLTGNRVWALPDASGTIALSEAVATALSAYIPIAYAGVPSGVATLDGGGKLTAAQLPDLAVSDFVGTSANQSAMLAKTGQKGDWTVRTDTSTTWIITGTDPTQLSDWTELGYPTAPVTSVNTKTGVVTLNQDDIGDGTTYKQYSATEKTKLAGVASGATANDSDSNLKNRANHTGTQVASTISDFEEVVRDTIGTALVQGNGIEITPDDGGNTITIEAIGVPTFIQQTQPVVTGPAVWYQTDVSNTIIKKWVQTS